MEEKTTELARSFNRHVYRLIRVRVDTGVRQVTVDAFSPVENTSGEGNH